MKHLRSFPASFTVEAALLMGILLPVLLALIYAGFLCHDRGVLQSSACETASLADNSAPGKNSSSDLEKYARQLGKNAVLASRDVSSSISLNDKFVLVAYTGHVSVPGILPRLFDAKTLSSGRSFSRKLLHPADTIRKIRGMQYLSSRLNGEGKTS